MERSNLKSPIKDSRRFALFGNRQWLCGENLVENTVVLSLTDQRHGNRRNYDLKLSPMGFLIKGDSGHSKPAYILNILHLFGVREIFQWSKVTTSINNLILGKLYCDHRGTMHIQGNHNYSCKLKFKEQSIIDQNPHQEKLSPIDLRLRPDQSLRVSWLLGNQKYYFSWGNQKSICGCKEAREL
ncbi:hypothetical protein FEM48_Zijuj07G0033200 [Ziziphus jujuba var. spinosa]|uniref:Uncharacterized protein n=1 Tax=Ziziphus jujuba var. spinosa TaxID=714518 RepID=A0A978V255_ZIZJJ|nr:hypothetical protein FEM48_Zijuj07G0033200 [Ziziphus jujuba var. spinosa]